jgi:hypothetical protein
MPQLSPMTVSRSAASLDSVLKRLSHHPVYLSTFEGNNGDRLIQEGARAMLGRSDATLTRRPARAGVIVLVGGGMMLGPHGGRRWLERMSRAYPEQDLVLLPSSFSGESIAPALAGRKAPSWIFARDPASLEALQAMQLPLGVSLGLDHDVSLQLEGSEFLARLHERSREKHLLIVERTDVEALTPLRDFWGFLERPVPPPVRVVPAPLRRLTRSALVLPRRLMLARSRTTAAKTPYARSGLERLLKDHPQFEGLPVVALDVGQTSVCSFEAYCRYVADAAAIITTRLHAGILAAMLGKPTYIDCTSAKLRAVYEYSLARFPNVRPMAANGPAG